MSRARDYIPSNAAQFGEFMQNLMNYVENKSSAWTSIPQARISELNNSLGKFLMALDNANLNHTAGSIHRRQEAQAATTALLRAFVNQFLRFPPVTDSDRVEMRIPNHDTIRTDHTVVTENVEFNISLSTVRQLVVDFWIMGEDHKAKPQGYDGAVIIWGVQDAQPETPEELEHHTMASRTPFTLFFDEEERGKTAWVACCWQNERGITGAWSAYKSAIVP